MSGPVTHARRIDGSVTSDVSTVESNAQSEVAIAPSPRQKHRPDYSRNSRAPAPLVRFDHFDPLFQGSDLVSGQIRKLFRQKTAVHLKRLDRSAPAAV
jgi:hypothetical protein